MKVVQHSTDSKDETWYQSWGEEDSVRNHYNELTVRFQEQTGSRRLMSIVFRVFNACDLFPPDMMNILIALIDIKIRDIKCYLSGKSLVIEMYDDR